MSYRIFFSIIILFASCANPLHKADRFYSKKNYEKAIPLYKNIVASQPFVIEPYFKLYHYENIIRKDTAEALQYLDKALLVAPREKKCEIVNIMRRITEKRIDRALENPSASKTYLRTTILEYNTLLHRYEINQCKEYSGFDSINASKINKIKFDLARRYAIESNYKEALALTDEVLAYNKQNIYSDKAKDFRIEILDLLANIAANNGDHAQTVYLLTRIEELTGYEGLRDEKLKEIYKKILKTATEKNDYDLMVHTVNRLCQFNEKEFLPAKEKIVLDQAAKLFQLASNSKDKSVKEKNYQHSLALINSVTGNEFVNKNKSRQLRYDIYSQLSELREQHGKLSEALDFLNLVIIESSDKTLVNSCKARRRTIYYNLAEISFKRNNYAEAIQFLNRILVEIPNDSSANELKDRIKLLLSQSNFQLGNSLDIAGEYTLAEDFYRQAAVVHSKIAPEAWLSISNMLKKAYLPDSANKYLERALYAAKAINIYEVLGTNVAELSAFETAKLHALKDDRESKEKAIRILKSLYRDNNYRHYRSIASRTDEFYNIKNDPRFRRWVNGKVRISISIESTSAFCDLDNIFSNTPEPDAYVRIKEGNFYLIPDSHEPEVAQATYHPRWAIPFTFDHNFDSTYTIEFWDSDDADRDEDDYCEGFRFNGNFDPGTYKTSGQNLTFRFSITETESASNVYMSEIYPDGNYSSTPWYSSESYLNIADFIVLAVKAVYCLWQTSLALDRYILLKFAEHVVFKGGYDPTQSKELQREIITEATQSYMTERYVSKKNREFLSGLSRFECFYDLLNGVKKRGR